MSKSWASLLIATQQSTRVTIRTTATTTMVTTFDLVAPGSGTSSGSSFTRLPTAPPGRSGEGQNLGEAGEFHGDAQAGGGRPVINTLQRGDIPVVTTAGDDNVAWPDGSPVSRVEADPLPAPPLHPGV